MDVVAALTRLGGVASGRDLLALTTRRRLRSAVERGEVEVLARGRFALAGVRGQRRVAGEMSAVLSHLSAAQAHGWALKQVPTTTWVTVKRNRKLTQEQQARLEVTYADLAGDEIADGVTSPLRTVVDCARKLPFDEALAVADAALRAGATSKEALVEATAALRGPGATAARRVARHADARAANPFESVLRAIVIESGVLDVVPQVPVATRTMTFHPDLVDVRRRVVVEADSWTWHRDQQTHDRDCVRHSALAVAGWVVLRFTWEQVMRSAPYVRAVLHDLAGVLEGRELTASLR
jgi:very-short-patch-repair endonuclease